MREDVSSNPALVRDQVDPTPNDSIPAWDLVFRDMQQRDQDGVQKYGVRLQAFNGRNPLVDAYQERLDDIVYTRAAIEQWNWMENRIKELEARVKELEAQAQR